MVVAMSKKPNKNRTLKILIASVIALILIAVIGKNAGWFGAEDATGVYVENPQKRLIVQAVSANGKIQPETEVKISSDVSGEIMELAVKEGDSVKQGQLLAIVNPDIYLSIVEQGEAAVNNAKANLANSKARLYQSEARLKEMEAQLDRNKKLYAQKLIADAEYEAIVSTHAAAKAEYESTKQSILAAEYTVKSQEASLKQARQNLTRTRIFAPVSGIVSKLNVEKGERVVGTSQMTGTEMMRISNLDIMEVNVDVNENDIIQVTIGDSAVVDVDAYAGRKFKGIVTEIAKSPTGATQQTSDQVTNYLVKVRILNSSYTDLTEAYAGKKSVFQPGMSASVEIQTESVSGAISIPIEAVVLKEQKDFGLDSTNNSVREMQEAVFVYEQGKAKLVPISTGIQDDKHIEVVTGLTEEQQVISGPYSAVSRILKTGSSVSIIEKQKLYKQ
jgi:HlyD family secretion protein